MSSVIVSGTFQNGDTLYTLPEGFDPTNIWLLVNGQVWTGSSLLVTGETVTVPGIDMTDELVEISDQSGSTIDTSSIESALSIVNDKLDAALSTPVAASTPAIVNTATTSVLITGNIARAKVQLSGRKQIQGMNKSTGRVLTDTDHLQQSIADILLTPIGSRVMRRTYGSRLLELISQPYVTATVLQVYAAIADALRQWEPRFIVKRIQAKWRDINQQSVDREAGLLNIEMSGDYLGRNVSVSVAI